MTISHRPGGGVFIPPLGKPTTPNKAGAMENWNYICLQIADTAVNINKKIAFGL